jgi:glycosyltransferase involved in cell wall biosynthesis
MRTTVLYFHTGSSSFVDKDIEILQHIGTVVPFSFTSKSKAGTPLLLFLQLGFLLRHLFSSRLFVAQFAGYHTFLPAVISRLTGKRLLIISGGTDCHSFPGIGYGNFQKQVLRIFTGWSFRLCNHIAPKHESLWFSEYTYDNSEPSHQGIKAFLPKLSTPHTSIPNGYDPDKWKPVPSVLRQPRSFLTVSGGFHFPFQQALKGIDLVLQIARRFPDCTFTVIGVDDPSVFKNPPPNVLLLPKADDAVLLKAYCSSTCNFQWQRDFRMRCANRCFAAAFRSVRLYFRYLKSSGKTVTCFDTGIWMNWRSCSGRQ